MRIPKAIIVCFVLGAAACGVESCELFVDAGELSVGESGLADLAGANEFSGAAGALRGLVSDDIIIDRSGAGTDVGAGADIAAGQRGARIAGDGSIIARERTWGRVSPAGDVFVRQLGSQIETKVGRVANGFIWAPDAGGNIIPIARIRGTLGVPTYQLRAVLRGKPGTVIVSSGSQLDVLGIREGWYEVRPSGTSSVGWIDASMLTVGLLGTDGLDTVAGSILTCARQDSLAGLPAPKSVDGSGRGDTVIRQSIVGKAVIVRYSSASKALSDSIAAILRAAGASVIRQEFDIAVTQVCGGDIYAHRDEFRVARTLQALLAQARRFPISSFDASEPRLIVWLK